MNTNSECENNIRGDAQELSDEQKLSDEGADEMRAEQENIRVVEVAKHFGMEGDWRTLADVETELREEITTGDSAKTVHSSPLPRNEQNPNAAKTAVFKFQELMAQKIERPEEIVEGLVCGRQNVLLMGRFGVGKTMLGTQLSLHLAMGREFLGLKISRPYRTMYIDFENDLGDMKNRISKQRSALALSKEEEVLLNENWIYVDAGDPKNALHEIRLDASDKRSLEPVTTLLKEHRPEVVVIDNLGLVATKGDLEKPEDATKFYENLNYIRSVVESLNDGAIIVFHHLTKPGEQHGNPPISLLTSPYEYLSRARGTGRLLDFARTRLALAEEMVGKEKCHVVNGINRSAAFSPLILQFNPETLSFERHDDTNLRFKAVFRTRPKGEQIYRLLPDEFTWSEAEKLKDQNTGKPFNKGTLSDTLKVSGSNDFIRYSPSTKLYTKIFDPQSD